MNLKSLKAACIEAAGKDEAYARARSIATELTTEGDRYTLSHKLVWQTLHAQLSDPTACLPSSHRVANQVEKISFSEICSTVEKEQNPFLAMLLVTVWLFAQWVRLLIWLAPRAIRLGRVTRLYAIALASSYTSFSHRIVHGTAFPLDSTEIPDACDLIGHVVKHFGKSIPFSLKLMQLAPEHSYEYCSRYASFPDSRRILRLGSSATRKARIHRRTGLCHEWRYSKP